MTRHVMKLPDIGEGVVDAELVEWRVQVGDAVAEDQHIADVMTDKATVEMSAPLAGTVVEIFGNPGDRIAVGAALIAFETATQRNTEPMATVVQTRADTAVEAKTPTTQAPSPAPASAPALAPASDRTNAAPAVRRRAREANIELTDVPASGSGGRITHEDLDAYINGGRRAAVVPVAPHTLALATAPAQTTAASGTRSIRVIGLRRVIAEKMALSKRRIPHYSYVEDVDITELEALRLHLNATRRDGQPKLTYLPFIIRALCKALRDFPQCNAHFDDEAGVVTQYDAVHVGVATQTPNGLMVPVVQHAETLDLWQSAAEMQRVSDAARSGKARREEVSGSTITISSLGKLGGLAATPVINHPEVAILGVNKSEERPVVRNGIVVVRLMMNLSASFDHRVVDGYDGASLVQAVKSRLEHPAVIFM